MSGASRPRTRICPACNCAPDVPYGGRPRNCTPRHCREQGIDPSLPEHVAARANLYADAGKALAGLGPGWKVTVTYNLRWFWHAWLQHDGGDTRIRIWPRDPGERGTWTVELESDETHGQVLGRGRTPRAALRNLRADVAEIARAWAAVAEEVGHSLGRANLGAVS